MFRSVSREQLPHCKYRFGEFELDLDREALSRAGQALRLRPKSFAVLRHLVQHAGRLVTKEELLSEIWGHLHVSEGSLTQCLMDIRRSLGDEDHLMVRTVPRRGFIFELKVVPYPARHVDDVLAPRSMPWRYALPGAIVLVLFLAAGGWLALNRNEAPTDRQPDLQAYNHYLRGKFFWHRRRTGDRALAEREFRKAVNIDPGFGAAWAGLAGAQAAHFYYAGATAKPAQLAAYHDVLEHAVATAPDLAEAHARLANYFLLVGDTENFQAHWKRARELGPDNVLVLSRAAGFALWRGDYNRAVDLQRRAAELRPLSAVEHLNLAGFLMAGGQFTEAEAQFREAQELSPELENQSSAFRSLNGDLTLIMILQHRYDEAFDLIKRQPAGDVRRDELIALAAWSMGHRSDYERAVTRMKRESGLRTHIRLAELDAFRGDKDGAFRHLASVNASLRRQAQPWAMEELMLEMRISPLLRPLRADPRWRQVINIPDSSAAVQTRKNHT